MISIEFPDNSKKEFEKSICGFDIAKSISSSLAKKAIAIKVNGELWDLSREIEKDAKVEVVVPESPEGLEVIRHSASHLMAEAVKELYPEVQVTIGPAIENGFYYDFSRKESFVPEDLEKIEKKMMEISERDEKISRQIMQRYEAVDFFKSIGEDYKAEIIASIPDEQNITLYSQGKFIDLCRGPHVPSTRYVKHFKLMKLAGAYWRGNSDNEMLQRVYGTAWASEDDLNGYLRMLEEAERRDHRKIGKEMDLFHLQDEAAGSIFWHDKGWTIFRLFEGYIREKLQKRGYIEVKTPIMVDRVLWEKSGHWAKFRENMFTIEHEDHVFALKPMNCPCHIQIFNQHLKSYRDLPLRMAEFGCCHRNESSGSLHGIMRVRALTQDDAHIFCTEDQIVSESKAFCELLFEIYKDMGFTDVLVKFSDRPEVRAGSDETWDKAEQGLKDAMNQIGVDFVMNPGEGAFYGPKLEFVLKDAIGRDWQCGTLQLDFVLPERLGATYIGADGQKHHPVMLHRAILGSIERFMGIMIENYEGKLPLWLAPVQVVVASITNEVDDYASEVFEKLKEQGIRAELDIDNEKIGHKVREHSLKKVPYIFAVGAKEKESGSVAVRRLGSDQQEVIKLNDIIEEMKGKVARKDLV